MEGLIRMFNSRLPRVATNALCPVFMQRMGMTTTNSLYWGMSAPAIRGPRRTELNYQELSSLLQVDQVSLIDVRSPKELIEYGEIPGAINIPLNEIKTALQFSESQWSMMFRQNKPTRSGKNLVFYARGPNASSTAVQIAHKLGFKASRHYTGGWEDYCKQTGIPLKKIPTKQDIPSSPYYGGQFEPFYM